ncbi:MAG: class I lanthipeptide [Candidatus Aminicenantes bacterium]|nr:MAG: class I lanthipeptide [Candidatus Aminicenantes bacterium]
MKMKRFDKKLLLNKKTIAHLDNGEMEVVYGGYIPPKTRLCSEKPPCS